jgi:hypothetical protein
MKPNMKEVMNWRSSLAELSAVQAQESLTPPELARIVVPASHWQALALDTTLIIGIRGAGKSFWTAVLANDHARGFVAQQVRSKELGDAVVKIGFSIDLSSAHHPSPAKLAKLVSSGFSRTAIWKAVISRHLAHANGKVADNNADWETVVRNYGDDVAFEKNVSKFDGNLKRENRTVLIVFDALDRLSKSWDDTRLWVQSLLEISLDLRSFSQIRLKLFLRPDMAEDETIWRFQDSSKLKHSAVELKWQAADLFSIVIRWVSNHDQSGPSFRKYCSDNKLMVYRKVDSLFVESENVGDSNIRQTLEVLTGKWMGTGPKRGFCFSWIPVHLADGHLNVAPRSLLLAMKTAAAETLNKYSNHDVPIHFEGIKNGVAKASEVRVDELNEDYPWITPLLEALEGQTVPLDVATLSTLWKDITGSLMNSDKLPPRRFSLESDNKKKIPALLMDLEDLGVVYPTTDKRINIPDIYRVGFRIGRRGGVRPIKTSWM